MNTTSNEEQRKCTICHTDYDSEEEGGIEGYLGIIPVSFCSSCFTGVVSMVEEVAGVSLDDIEPFEDEVWRKW
jgi:hypothetical protein